MVFCDKVKKNIGSIISVERSLPKCTTFWGHAERYIWKMKVFLFIFLEKKLKRNQIKIKLTMKKSEYICYVIA